MRRDKGIVRNKTKIKPTYEEVEAMLAEMKLDKQKKETKIVTDEGKWIMLTTKLPTQVSPPKLSIFWSTFWPMEDRFLRKSPDIFGMRDPDGTNSRKIYYKGENIRVFPHEFTDISAENMNHYIDSGVYVLMPDSVAEGTLFTQILTKDNRLPYDMARICGASETQAIIMALGKEPNYNLVADFPPAVGWYKCAPEYATVFCYENEMTE